MASRIGGGGPKVPVDPKIAQESGKAEKAGGKTEQSSVKQTVDSFDNKVANSLKNAAPQIASKLQAMAPKQGPKLQFTSADIAQLAGMFAASLKQNPGADRKKRARMFAKSILKSKLGKLLDQVDEEELEEMYDLIAGQLDDSPVLAQLVDDVTEGARKILG
jgi:hypothetical protein